MDTAASPTTGNTPSPSGGGDLLFDARSLGVTIGRRSRRRTLVSDFTASVRPGEVLSVVGESGSGKSLSLMASMRLLPRGLEASGHLEVDGRPVLAMSADELRDHRTHTVAMIHQDPRSHINPLYTVSDFMTEAVVDAGMMTPGDATDKARDLLDAMEVPRPDVRLGQNPRQLSGGLLQRVMIAAAMMTDPALVLADEPTTALDVRVQSEILALLLGHVHDKSMGMIFVTHDLEVASAISDTIAVMYAGRVIETGSADAMYEDPRHPYTAALLAARPRIDQRVPLRPIPGRPVAAHEVTAGCVFASRCEFATDICRTEIPHRRAVDDHLVACHLTEEIFGTGSGAVPGGGS